ncbi:hypothetical protein B0H11DRAFT_1903794 [Mycena galericulata]|nr:hypothetical protein B0H11DRAFT_1903794 [Mycena galericulata]
MKGYVLQLVTDLNPRAHFCFVFGPISVDVREFLIRLVTAGDTAVARPRAAKGLLKDMFLSRGDADAEDDVCEGCAQEEAAELVLEEIGIKSHMSMERDARSKIPGSSMNRVPPGLFLDKKNELGSCMTHMHLQGCRRLQFPSDYSRSSLMGVVTSDTEARRWREQHAPIGCVQPFKPKIKLQRKRTHLWRKYRIYWIKQRSARSAIEKNGTDLEKSEIVSHGHAAILQVYLHETETWTQPVGRSQAYLTTLAWVTREAELRNSRRHSQAYLTTLARVTHEAELVNSCRSFTSPPAAGLPVQSRMSFSDLEAGVPSQDTRCGYPRVADLDEMWTLAPKTLAAVARAKPTWRRASRLKTLAAVARA